MAKVKRKYKFILNVDTGKRQRVFEKDLGTGWSPAQLQAMYIKDGLIMLNDKAVNRPSDELPEELAQTVNPEGDGSSVLYKEDGSKEVIHPTAPPEPVTKVLRDELVDKAHKDINKALATLDPGLARVQHGQDPAIIDGGTAIPRLNKDGHMTRKPPIALPGPQPQQGNRQVHCFYHYDLDGCAAAAVVRMRLPWAIMHPIEYSYKVLEPTAANAEVIFVDFTPRLTDMTDLTRTGDRHVTWIDHHRTALEAMRGQGFDKMPGLRSVDHSGAYLAWKFFYPQLAVPRAIELVDLWDTWTHEDAPDVLNFKAGIEIHDSSPQSRIWDDLLASEQPGDVMERICHEGSAIMESQRIYWAKCCDMYGFECRFRHLRYGKISCFGLFLPDVGSLAFATKPDYEVYLGLIFNGKQYRVSLYSNTGINVAEIATHYGGGGHAGAAGFWCDELPLTSDTEFDGSTSPAATKNILAAVRA